MHILFIDESGTPPPPDKVNSKYMVLGGIIIPEDQWHKVRDDLRRIKSDYNINGEIKWRYFSPSNNDQDNSMKHLMFEDKKEVRKKIIDIVNKYKSVKIISVLIDINKAYGLEYVNNEDQLYWYSYKQLVERFQYHLQDMSRSVGQTIHGIVVCDNRNKHHDNYLRNLHENMILSNKENLSNIGNLIEGLFISPSHHGIGIQIADIIAGAIFQKYERNHEWCFNQLQESFRKNPKNNNIYGWGLVVWPK